MDFNDKIGYHQYPWLRLDVYSGVIECQNKITIPDQQQTKQQSETLQMI